MGGTQVMLTSPYSNRLWKFDAFSTALCGSYFPHEFPPETIRSIIISILSGLFSI